MNDFLELLRLAAFTFVILITCILSRYATVQPLKFVAFFLTSIHLERVEQGCGRTTVSRDVPIMNIGRSPLKETDANLKTGNDLLKKRSLDRLEQQQHRKRTKTNDASRRTIEGAVQMSKQTALKKVGEQSKVTPHDLLEWQNNWRKIMRRDTKIYFDTTEVHDTILYAKQKLDKKKDLLKRGFLSLGAQITQFFDTDVTIVVTMRTVKSTDQLPDTDVLARAAKRYMKVWTYEKATRFLKNLDVDLDTLESKAQVAYPTLSNLLQNEKIYGPADRDPKTRRDDVHYFKYPHIYLYDLWQIWAPIIIMEWKPQDLVDPHHLPYPSIKPGTFGRCPFIGDGHCDESSSKRIIKRYKRDKVNEKYALHLRLLYQESAEPQDRDFGDEMPIILSHNHANSRECYENLMKINNSDEVKSNESTESSAQKQESLPSGVSVIPKPPSKAIWKTPAAFNPPVLLLSRQDTEEFADDLCRKKPRIPQEIKASGVNQSNDGSASIGNGLGPTKASVLNKNMKSLNRLVVDKKFHPAKGLDPVESTPPLKTKLTSIISTQIDASKEKPKEKKTEVKRQDFKLGSGYCENCRVKYDCLAHHINTDKHQHFAHDDMNFEAIDSLIEKLAASRALNGGR